MGAIHHRHMITTDASMTGWGAVFEGKPARGEWIGEFLSWHINCLELRAVLLALIHFLPVLGKHYVIVRTDNMVVVSHINRQGGSWSRTLDRKSSSPDSVETETRAGRVDIEPFDSSPDLGYVWQSVSGPLCFTGVVPMPTL